MTDAQHRVLVSCPLIQDSIADYSERFSRHNIAYDVPEVDQQLSESELIEIIDRYDGVIAGDDDFTESVFEAASRLRVLMKWGIGTDNIDHDAAASHGVTVLNTPGAFAPEVADVVIGYAVMLTRHLHRIDQAIREGTWATPRGISLRDKTLGIIGVGNIGTAVARRGVALEMDLLGHDVVPIDPTLKDTTGMVPVEIDELFRRSDLVTLHCPLTPDTEGLVGAEQLGLLGPDGYLINTARGRLIDQSALIDALSREAIAGAALDVFETEPLSATSPLTDMDAVILGSHNAQNTVEAVADVNDRAVEGLLAELLE